MKYVNENKSKLRIGNNICLSGESGGGNLSLALTLKLKHNNELHLCNGVYVLCPYIAGHWDQKKSNEGILGQVILEKCHQVYEWHMGIPSKHLGKRIL